MMGSLFEQVLLETHEPILAQDEKVLLSLLSQTGAKFSSFHSESNIYHTSSREVLYNY